MALAAQQRAQAVDGGEEVAAVLLHHRQQQVAAGVAAQPRVLGHRQPREQDTARLALVARQRQRAAQHVARRQHAELVAQLTRTPPLSNIVTMAWTISHGLDLRPPSRLGSPVPPPKHPTFRVRSCMESGQYNGLHDVVAVGRLADRQRATALDTLVIDLRTIFGSRLLSLVAYGLSGRDSDDDVVRTLALVEQLTFDDLSRAAPLTSDWQRRGLAVPLLLSTHEFNRTLDVSRSSTAASSPITS